jgi:Bacterial PH domain
MSSQPDEAIARDLAPTVQAQSDPPGPPETTPTRPAETPPARPAEPTPARRAEPAPTTRAGVSAGRGIAARLGGKAAAEDKVVFRRGGPLALWWLWVAFAVFNFFDVAVRDHDYFSVELTAGLLAITAVVYACTLRPRVVADDNGINVYNPYRDHLARWHAVNGVFLGDSVEIVCTRPSPKKDKTIYCWALYAGRRSRRRGQARAERHEARVTGRTVAQVREQRQPDAVAVMAAELGRRSTEGKQRGASPATLESTWAWLPIGYLLVPAAVLLALLLAR